MKVLVTCTGCSQQLQVAVESAGGKVRCPQCQTVFDAIPDANVAGKPETVNGEADPLAAISLEQSPADPKPVAQVRRADAPALVRPILQLTARENSSSWGLVLLAIGLPAAFFGLLVIAAIVGVWFLLSMRAATVPAPVPEPGPLAAMPQDLDWNHEPPNGAIRRFIMPELDRPVDRPPIDFNPPANEIDVRVPPDVAEQLRRLFQPDDPPRMDPGVPLIRSLKVHPTCVWSVAFSADGSTLLTADGYHGPPGHVKLWKTDTGELLDTLHKPESDVLGAVFSPDEDHVASASGEQGLHLINRKTREVKSRISHPSYVRSAAFTRDGKFVASNCESFVRVWEIDGNRELWRADLRDGLRAWRLPTPLAFSPDGKTLAAGNGGNDVHVYDAATGKVLASCVGHEGLVLCTAYSKEGKLLASGGFDKSVVLWDSSNHKELRTLRGHRDWVFSVAFAPDGKTLASAGREGTVTVWDVATGKTLASMGAHSSEAVCVAFAPDGKILASCGRDGTVKLWDVSKLPGK